jgi:hypothetical protein
VEQTAHRGRRLHRRHGPAHSPCAGPLLKTTTWGWSVRTSTGLLHEVEAVVLTGARPPPDAVLRQTRRLRRSRSGRPVEEPKGSQLQQHGDAVRVVRGIGGRLVLPDRQRRLPAAPGREVLARRQDAQPKPSCSLGLAKASACRPAGR